MQPYSLHALSQVAEGKTAAEALAPSVDLARAAERWRHNRFWQAEHHNMPGIASAATAFVIGRVAVATHSIRDGVGGIMLPNHAPLLVAEAFEMLAMLSLGCFDLGLGHALGTDMATARMARKSADGALCP